VSANEKETETAAGASRDAEKKNQTATTDAFALDASD
jgi:hypothetical protein